MNKIAQGDKTSKLDFNMKKQGCSFFIGRRAPRPTDHARHGARRRPASQAVYFWRFYSPN
jgi:hypothetical protein